MKSDSKPGTMASLIGVPDNPGLEAARRTFSSEAAKIQRWVGREGHNTVLDFRRAEWESARRIVNAYLVAMGLPEVS